MGPFKKEYEYFLTLCETPNISEASEIIGIQQAGLSKSLKKLEESLGFPLFYRTNRGLKVTDFGKIVQKNLSNLTENWHQQFESDQRSLDEVMGNFKLGIHPTIAISSAHKFYPYLTENYQNLNLHLELASSAHVTKKVINHELDFALVANPIQHPDLVIIKLQKEFIAAWGTEEKSQTDVLYFNPDMLDIVNQLKKYKNFKKVPIKDYEVLAKMAASSKGICILPSPVALRQKRMKMMGRKIMDIDLCLIYRVDHIRTVGFNKIIEVIKAKLV